VPRSDLLLMLYIKTVLHFVSGKWCEYEIPLTQLLCAVSYLSLRCYCIYSLCYCIVAVLKIMIDDDNEEAKEVMRMTIITMTVTITVTVTIALMMMMMMMMMVVVVVSLKVTPTVCFVTVVGCRQRTTARLAVHDSSAGCDHCRNCHQTMMRN